MDNYYLMLIIFLSVLAVLDLVVGVSNDAVNFLNSAIGSKVASFKSILTLATIGIVVGASMSGGMMEVAQKGIFNPSAFFFAEIMIIFIAVMLADVVLLDVFNTFGIPTSTTVSVIFGLLGASVAVSAIKISNSGESFTTISNYINIDSAINIVSGILMSIWVSFLVGGIVMFFSRMLFTFQVEKQYTWVTQVWAGLAMMSMTYYLIIKGLKGSNLLPHGLDIWIKENTAITLLGLFVFWTLLLGTWFYIKKNNTLAFVVKFGTFGLAMAFAGNDLVNFIGIPLAGWEAYKIWAASGFDANELLMEGMNKSVQSNIGVLMFAGVVMALTLWFSKKARTVTETEVSLGRQEEGFERFQPSSIARSVVKFTKGIGNALVGVMPNTWNGVLQNRLDNSVSVTNTGAVEDRPAFDLLRASVNLAAASSLIALATSLKLPLSTTFVTFIVAMATSFADKAWGGDSAVYRVTGVLNIIGSWLVTAIAAFSIAGLFAFLIIEFGPIALGLIIALALTLVYRTYHLHKQGEEKKERRLLLERNKTKLNRASFMEPASLKIGDTMRQLEQIFTGAINGTIQNDAKQLASTKTAVTKLRDNNVELGYELHHLVKNLDDNNQAVGHAYLRIYNIENDLIIASRNLLRNANRHVNNLHIPVTVEQQRILSDLRDSMIRLFELINGKIAQKDFSNIADVTEMKKNIQREIDNALHHQIEGVRNGSYNPLNSRLMFGLLSEMKAITTLTARFAKLLSRTELDSDIDWEW